MAALRSARGTRLCARGGSALLALGTIARPTRDIDAFVAAKAETPPGDVGPLVAALRARLLDDGWAVTVDRELVTFARLVVTQNGDAVEIDLAVDSPPLFPLAVVDGLPVLSGQDLAARKVLAILDRAEGRDFTDLEALAEQFTKDDCIRSAQELDSGVRRSDVAAAMAKLERLQDADLPCSPEVAPSLRSWFERWSNRRTNPRSLKQRTFRLSLSYLNRSVTWVFGGEGGTTFEPLRLGPARRIDRGHPGRWPALTPA